MLKNIDNIKNAILVCGAVHYHAHFQIYLEETQHVLVV